MRIYSKVPRIRDLEGRRGAAFMEAGMQIHRQIWDTVRLRRKQLRGLVSSLSQKIWQKILLVVFMYIRRPRCKI